MTSLIETVIRKSESLKQKRKRIIKDSPSDDDKDNPNGRRTESKNSLASSSKEKLPNQGILKLDASVADQYITHPTDLKLLNTAREETKRLVDDLYNKGDFDK